MSHQERIQALRQALDLSPDNHPLRLMLAEALQAAGETAAALAEYKILLEADQIGAGQLVSLGKTAVAADDLDMASRCLDAALKAGIIEGIRELRTLDPPGCRPTEPGTTSHPTASPSTSRWSGR
jgi:tetratricopeptide (TPR) repeat protein